MTKSRGINAPRHTWSDQELATLRKLYPHQRTADIAELLGIDLQLVYRRASLLGLRKSEAFAASDKSGRIFKGGTLGQKTQFTPGQKPWNTGTHYVAGGRSAETRFKKGQMSGAAQRKYVPIGTLRISKDGYLERKVTDDPTLMSSRRWTPVHRLVWQAAHGPIPAGHIVVYRPGMKTTVEAEITTDRLECISRAENARRNSIWKCAPEMVELYHLKKSITRQVNRIKEATHAQPTH
jgi:hypothetical protein